MTISPIQPTDSKIQLILARLNSADTQQRLAAMQAVSDLPYINKQLAAKLESLAVNDANPANRAEALKILRSPLYREFHMRWGGASRGTRSALVEHIKSWEKEGLIDPELASVLETRYSYDFKPPREESRSIPVPSKHESAPPPRQKEKSRSLGEILLSQGTINIALYLGTFLILAAALYYSAFSDALRIPILSAATVLFGGGAFGLKRRLPAASLVLFIIYSLLVPILGLVILEASPALQQQEIAFWVVVNIFLGANWAIASLIYKSKLFSFLTYASFNILPFQLTQLLNLDREYTLLLVALSNLISMAVIWRLHNPKKEVPSDSVLPVSQLAQIFLLAATVLQIAGSSSGSDLGLISLFMVCLLGIIYYLLAQRIRYFPSSAYSATSFLFLLPWPLIMLLPYSSIAGVLFSLVWGSTFAIAGHWTAENKKIGIFANYSTPLLLGSALLYLLAAGFGLSAGAWYLFLVPLCAGIVYTGITFQQPRNLIWGAALSSFLMAYAAFFGLPFMKNIDIFPGFIALWPGLVLLSGEIWIDKARPREPILKNWLTGFGWVVGAFAALTLIDQASVDVGRASLGLLILGLFLFGYSVSQKRIRATYFSAASLTLAVTYSLQTFRIDYWFYVLFALAVVYYLAATFYSARSRFQPWSRPWQISGLLLAGIVALLTFADESLHASMIMFLLVMTLFLAAIMIEQEKKIPQTRYKFFLQLGSWILTALAILQLIAYEDGQSLWATLVLTAYTALFAFYAWRTNTPKVMYVATAAFTGAVLYLETFLGIENWFLGLLLLAVGYVALGYLPYWKKEKSVWSRVLRLSGLAVGGLLAASAVLFEGPLIVISIAMIATLFALESWQQHKIWPAILADLIYIEAYFFALDALSISEPQFFTTGAAVLGLALHYLLRRMGEPNVTFLAGMTSQIVLLGTSYLQMVRTENLIFFLIIFFQALAVIIYGTIIRSRSLVIVPIGFVVLGVGSIVLRAFSDFLSLIVIGCSGITLLLLGISALFLRERIGAAGKKVRATLAEWSA